MAAGGKEAGLTRPQVSASRVESQQQSVAAGSQGDPARQRPEPRPRGLDWAFGALARAWQGWRQSRLLPNQAMLAVRPEASLESLRDLQWELREREARYRDLLDHQGDVILRRDKEQRLTFVNDAFCRAFGRCPRRLLTRYANSGASRPSIPR